MRKYVAFVSETLTDHFVGCVGLPPRRGEVRSDYGLRVETAVDVYMDTKVRMLGLWVWDTDFKYFGIRPQRLPSGVGREDREYIAKHGIMIGPPLWVSRSQQTVLTVERARIEARRLLSLIRTLVPSEGHLDGNGVLVLDYNPPRKPRRPRVRTHPRCPTCGHAEAS